MSQHLVTVEDDPEHPEGGHALILFEGLTDIHPDATLMIEAVDESSNEKWPVARPLAIRRGPAGIAIAVDERIVEALPAGTAVTVTIPESAAHGEVLWPALTPLLRQARRRPSPITQRARRVVADPARPERVTPFVSPPVRESLPEPGDEPSEPILRREQKVDGGSVEKHSALPEEGKEQESNKERDVARDDPMEVTPVEVPGPPPAEPRRGLGAMAAAAIAFASLGAGGAIGWFAKPLPQEAPPRAALAAAPATQAFVSPYDFLTEIGPASPGGKAADANEPARTMWVRGRTAAERSSAEGDYWYKQAALALLRERSRLTAATFNSLANAIGRQHADAPGIAAARFLWELAAAGRDCGAIHNLEVVHMAQPGGSPIDAAAAERWRKHNGGSCPARATDR